MTKLLVSMSKDEVLEMIKNIDQRKLCLLMMGMGEDDQDKIFSYLSNDAKKLLKIDIVKLEIALQGVEL